MFIFIFKDSIIMYIVYDGYGGYFVIKMIDNCYYLILDIFFFYLMY